MVSFMTYFWTAFFSLLPISELRGAIPYAISNGIPWYVAYGYCVFLNALVGPLVFIFLSTVHKLFYRWEWYQGIFDKFVDRARHKLEDKIKSYGFWAIMLFVAIPFPITGAYTGTLAAWVFGLKKRKTFLAVLLGVMISGAIVTSVWFFGGEAIKAIFIKDIH